MKHHADVGPDVLRRAMGRFATWVAIVTALDESGGAHGMTVNSLTSVSLTPPCILVCLMAAARTTRAIRETKRYAVSVLASWQASHARRFARMGGDHFGELPLTFEQHQVPVVPGALAHIECDLEQSIVCGDHVICIGRVVRVCHQEGNPLAFIDSSYTTYGDDDLLAMPAMKP